ncbi:helix-turn-helix domain-containing protein [Paenibacillus doosanensis]|uniref:helix-turn-helix domain-containing protein n=1 Tax=Paenibacillus doosanensis TaxID=1229154 RepID=UPI0021804BC5|nr:helix-turn-helix domain-containing protein [Paenibacillus doosanensis]MCS7462340.1 helix-turn-helix domain-containing protein [Paenibacillus doosanensis]
MKLRLNVRLFGNRRNALKTLIVSNLFILLIPMAMGLFLYAKVEESLEKSTNRSNAAMLEQLRLLLDNKLSEVDNLTRQVVFDPKLDYMLKISDHASSADDYQFVEFMRDKMTRYRSMTSSFIFDYFVYFARSDKIVKADLLTDSHTFYSTYYTFQGQPYEQWKQGLLTGLHKVSYLPVASLARGLNPMASIETFPKEVIVYVKTLPVSSPADHLGNFVVLIDVDQIKGMFAQLESASHSAIYIIDNDGQTIMSTSATPFPGELLKRMEHTDAPFGYKLGGVDQMVSFVSSQKAGFKYVSITPNDVFMQQVNQIQTWSLGLFILCLIAGLLAVIAGVYRSYKPLQKTVNAIMRGKRMSGRPSFDEYEFIRQTFEGSIHEENHLRSTLTKQTPFIRANYLSRLLHGHMDVDVSAENEDSLRFMDLALISDRFAVVLIQIEDIQHLSEDSEQQWALARFIVSNISVDLIKPPHKGFPVELDRERLALLINLQPEPEEKAETDIRDIVQSLYDLVSQRFKIGITVAAGGIHQGPKAIRDSYPEALAALEYRLILGKNAIIHFQDIAGTKQHYYYPLEMEVQLTNFVRSGDADNVGKLLDKIYSMNFDSGGFTPELGKCLFFNVISTFLKIVNSTNTNQQEVLGEDFDPIKAVFSHSTAEGMQLKTKELYETLTRTFNVERSDHRTQLLQDMVAFIDRALDDPNLGLAMIADRFHMTPQYISTFFKKNQGQTLLDYITNNRIKASKRLMDNRDLTIAQIAQLIGYNNDVVFIRAFKKLEGVTPGKYRETIAPDTAVPDE